MAGVYLDMSCEDESGEKCGQEIQKRRFPTYPGDASPSMEGPHLSGKMVELDASGFRKRNWTTGINPAGDEAGSVAMAFKNSLNTPISFGSVSLSGRAREMEDAISVRPGFVQFQDACAPFHFFAVFDGHGGSHVSALCKEMMHSVLAEEIMAEPARGVSSGAEETRWKSAVERCFRRMDRLALSACACGRVGEPTCTCERSGIESDIVGSTAVIAVVGGGRLLVANCGDSRAVLSRGGRTVPLSVDHKPDRPDELARIEAAGGRVIYVNGARVHGILAMSRALGDKYLKPVVISAPEIVISEITAEDECLIIASDGLWDVIPNELACSIAMRCLADRTSNCGGSGGRQMEERLWAPKSWCSTAAALLARLALGRKSADNISVIVVDLRTEFPP